MKSSQAIRALLPCLLLAGRAQAVEMRLEPGTVVVLAGIEVPAELAGPAHAALASLPAGAAPDRAAAPDRYGRLRGQVRAPDGSWAQAALVRAGLAVVAPVEDVAAATLAELLDLEREARAARRGVWQGRAAGPWPAGEVPSAPPHYLLVEGRPLEVARARGFVYVNFGRRWLEDFTLRAEEGVARRLAKEGLDLAGLAGRNLRVRGLVFEENGPMIELVDKAQVELLP